MLYLDIDRCHPGKTLLKCTQSSPIHKKNPPPFGGGFVSDISPILVELQTL